MSHSSLALAAPAFRLAPKRRARPRGFAPPLAVAIALHAALVALLIVAVRPHPLTEPDEAPAFTMVFAPEVPPETPSEPQPSAAPPAASEPSPPVAVEPPVEIPPAPAEPPVAATPPPPEPPPEVAAPPEPPPPPHVLARPQRPVTPLRPIRPPARPAPRRPVTPVARAPEAPTLPDVPPSAAAPPSRTPVEAPAPRPAPSPSATAPVSPGWRDSLMAWLQAHKTYPDAARMEGVEGRVLLLFTAARDGRVLQVTVAKTSGSRMLDEAAEALLRGARLPPFPAGMAQDTATLTVPLNYQLE